MIFFFQKRKESFIPMISKKLYGNWTEINTPPLLLVPTCSFSWHTVDAQSQLTFNVKSPRTKLFRDWTLRPPERGCTKKMRHLWFMSRRTKDCPPNDNNLFPAFVHISVLEPCPPAPLSPCPQSLKRELFEAHLQNSMDGRKALLTKVLN